VVKDMVGQLPDELRVSKSVECDTFYLQCFNTVGSLSVCLCLSLSLSLSILTAIFQVNLV